MTGGIIQMNLIKFKLKTSENISLATDKQMGNNGVLSQNEIAVTPNCQNWLFYCLSQDNNLSYQGFVPTKHLSNYDGVTPQNKPIGEYVGRLLFRPRVNPITLFIGRFSQTQNEIGTTMFNPLFFKLSHLSPIQSLAIGFILGLPIACLVIGFFDVTGGVK